MKILNIAGYKFISLNGLSVLRTQLFEQCGSLHLKGTILLSKEGININLAGLKQNMSHFLSFLKNDSRFEDISFHESYSNTLPFKRLKIKIKKEIITLRKPEADPVFKRAPSLSPALFKQWLDEKRDVTLLDTRNDYEVRFGTFTHAVNLAIADFCEFPTSLDKIERDKPIVMFCTGGIRCEKAALYLIEQGCNQVYQLDGGILGYFAKVGGAHYEGECFVFDERVSVDATLNVNHTIQCKNCHGPVTKENQQLPGYIPGVSCPACG
jgi:UPF0176 protein